MSYQTLMDELVESVFSIIDELVEARESQNISLEEIAKNLRISVEELEAIEAFDSSPRLEIVAKYAYQVNRTLEFRSDAWYPPLRVVGATTSKKPGKVHYRITQDKVSYA